LKIAVGLLLAAHAAAGAAAEPRAIVQRAFELVLADGGFRGHAEGNILGPGTPPISGDVDVVFPDRIHVRTDATEFIVMSGEAWVSAFGLWAPADPDLLPVTAFDVAAMRRAITSIRDVRDEGGAGTKACAAHVYRFRSSGQLPLAATAGDVRAWICDGSNRLSRVEAAQTRGGADVAFEFDWTRRPDVRAPDG
jgi:hypothetical protein